MYEGWAMGRRESKRRWWGGRDVKGKKGEGDRQRGSAALDKIHGQTSKAPPSPPPTDATLLFTEPYEYEISFYLELC